MKSLSCVVCVCLVIYLEKNKLESKIEIINAGVAEIFSEI